MIKMNLELLSKVESLERLLARLPEFHANRSYVEMQLHRAAAGVRGEARVRRKFTEFYVEEAFDVIWNISLKLGQWRVQMDGLLLTEKCAVVIESKNISGKLHYNQLTEEFFRLNSENEKTVMENPAIQLKKNTRFLTQWFKFHKIELPVDGLIVFTAKNCEFYSKPPGVRICKTYQMNEYLYEILPSYPQETAPHKLTKIQQLIRTEQTPYERTPLCELYQIRAEELKTGVYCQFCKSHSMQRQKQSWHCVRCDHHHRFAHILAIQEFFSLIHTDLTNQQFRNFCKIDSPDTARRLLMQFDLELSGDYKSRVYRLKKMD